MNSFLTQVAMTVLSVGILFFYIQPTFTNIGTIQDSILLYQTETAKVSEVNARLESLVSRVNNITTADMRALLTYMPDTVDHVAITRDIYAMAEQTNIFLKSIRYEKVPQSYPGQESSVTEDSPGRHGFSLNFSGSYTDIKLFLSFLEQNNYPLEVHDLRITTTESGLLEVDMMLITYSQTIPL